MFHLFGGQWLPDPPKRGNPAKSSSLKRVLPRKCIQEGSPAATSNLSLPSSSPKRAAMAGCKTWSRMTAAAFSSLPPMRRWPCQQHIVLASTETVLKEHQACIYALVLVLDRHIQEANLGVRLWCCRNIRAVNLLRWESSGTQDSTWAMLGT